MCSTNLQSLSGELTNGHVYTLSKVKTRRCMKAELFNGAWLTSLQYASVLKLVTKAYTKSNFNTFCHDLILKTLMIGFFWGI